MAPLWFSSYVLLLRVPDVSLMTENIADFISAYIIGNLLQMAFRFWAFRRWVFPHEFGRNPDEAIESTLTDGGLAEVIEDQIDAGKLTLIRRGCRGGVGQSAGGRVLRDVRLSDSSEPRVSETS